MGHPLDQENAPYAELFEKEYKGSFDAFSTLTDEIVINVESLKIILWEYHDSKP